MEESQSHHVLSNQDRLYALINKHAAFPEYPLELQTSIQRLGLDGDEFCELINEIQQEFGVDLSEIDHRYFTDEFMIGVHIALTLFAPIIWLGMYLTGKGKRTDLWVGDLLNAIETGRWQHPDRPGKFPWE